MVCLGQYNVHAENVPPEGERNVNMTNENVKQRDSSIMLQSAARPQVSIRP